MAITFAGKSEAECEELIRDATKEFDSSPLGAIMLPLVRAGDEDAKAMRLEKILAIAKRYAGVVKSLRASVRETLTKIFNEVKVGNLSLLQHLRKNVMLNRRYLRITVMLEDANFELGKGQNKRIEKLPMIVGLAPAKDKKRVKKTERMAQVAAAVNRIKA